MYVTIIGNLGADPESRQAGNGNVCNLSLAENLRKRDVDGNWIDHTIWHRISVWGKQGENCQSMLRKGSKVLVIGSIQIHDYRDKEGQVQTSHEVNASEVAFLANYGKDEGGRGGGQGGGGSPYGRTGGGQPSGGQSSGGQSSGGQGGGKASGDTSAPAGGGRDDWNDIPF